MRRNTTDVDAASPTAERDRRTCVECGDHIRASNEATRQGVRLCADHATEERIERERDHQRHKSGLECAVCHKPLLAREATNRGPTLCETHDEDDYRAKMDHEQRVRREAMERDHRRYAN